MELAGMIRAGEVSSREVIDAHLDRLDQVNPHLNAVVRVLGDQARHAADAADARQRAGERLGALHGVPFTVKENIDVAGTPTTSGIAVLAEAMAASDAPMVERLRAAGAIPIGRTNLPDLGLRVTTESSLHGVTRNPWHPHRTAGGSSGGEGAAIAAGISPLGLGNDLGGSLRNPAHCCGITSIKPTGGVVPAATSVPPDNPPLSFQLMAVEGVMARRVADLRASLLIVAGRHHRDPASVPAHLAVRHDGGRPWRVAVLAEPPGGSTHPHIAAGVRRAADALADAGHQVQDATPPDYERSLMMWRDILSADLRLQRPLLDLVMGDDARAFLDATDAATPSIDLATWAQRLTERVGLGRAWSAWFTEFDVLLCPTWTQPPFATGADVLSPHGSLATLELMRPVLPANVLSLPAVVVPAGVSDGLPVGVQLVGDRFDDLTCLAVAEVVEQHLGVLTPIDPVLTGS
jgi:amidase